MADISNQVLQLLENRAPLKGPDKNGRYKTLCPFHDETEPSFYFHPELGFKCFGCDAKGGVRVLAEKLGIDTEPLTIDEMASAKGIPAEWLKSKGLVRQGTTGVQIIYRNQYGVVVGIHTRKNISKYAKGSRFSWRSGDKSILYGLEDIDSIKQAGYVLLPEGETDKWALQYYDFPALGIPGANNWNPSMVSEINGINPYLCMDSDKGGRMLLTKVASDIPNLRVIKMPDGYKDVCELYQAKGQQFVELMQQLITAAPLASEVIDQLDLQDEINTEKFLTSDKKETVRVDADVVLKDIMSNYCFKTMRDTGEILVYRDGVYRFEGEVFIEEQIENRVKIAKVLTTHMVNEIVNHIRRRTYIDREHLNSNAFVLNLNNGLLDIRDKRLLPHSSEFLSTIRIPVDYDPDADCPQVRKFLSEIVHSEDLSVLIEIIGYCLLPQYRIQRAFILHGLGENGKSTLIELIQKLLGSSNCSNVPLQALIQKAFYAAQLYGKLANVFADLSPKALYDTSLFKMLTGGDVIMGEHKFKPPFYFKNHAKLIFSANQPPQILDESYALWRRLIIINFPNEFPPGKLDVDLIDELTTEEELSGLLNSALDGLTRLLKNQDFSYRYSVDEVVDRYQKASNPVYAFLREDCELDSDNWIIKEELYAAFRAYCADFNIPTLQFNAFGRAMNSQTAIIVTTTKKTVGAERVNAWQGLKITNYRNVKDVKVFQVPNAQMQLKDVDNTSVQNEINKEKNVDNPDNPDGDLGKPTKSCHQCGAFTWWQRPDGGWVCGVCHPKP